MEKLRKPCCLTVLFFMKNKKHPDMESASTVTRSPPRNASAYILSIFPTENRLTQAYRFTSTLAIFS
jgi:hypothetical protein